MSIEEVTVSNMWEIERAFKLPLAGLLP